MKIECAVKCPHILCGRSFKVRVKEEKRGEKILINCPGCQSKLWLQVPTKIEQTEPEEQETPPEEDDSIIIVIVKKFEEITGSFFFGDTKKDQYKH